MKVVRVDKAAFLENPHGVDARKLFKDERTTVVHISMKPGEAMKRHSAEEEALFYVIEGRGLVEIGEEREEVGPDTLIECPAKAQHRWINSGEGPLRFLVIKLTRTG